VQSPFFVRVVIFARNRRCLKRWTGVESDTIVQLVRRQIPPTFALLGTIVRLERTIQLHVLLELTPIQPALLHPVNVLPVTQGITVQMLVPLTLGCNVARGITALKAAPLI